MLNIYTFFYQLTIYYLLLGKNLTLKFSISILVKETFTKVETLVSILDKKNKYINKEYGI